MQEYVPPSASRKKEPKWNFDEAKPGYSIWVGTHSERVYLHRAFKEWREKFITRIDAFTVAVGDEDPQGKGYRLVFEDAGQLNLRPTAASRIRTYEQYTQETNALATASKTLRMQNTGITSQADVEAAIVSTKMRPDISIAEAKMIDAMIYKQYATPFQQAYMKANNIIVNELGFPMTPEQHARNKAYEASNRAPNPMGLKFSERKTAPIEDTRQDCDRWGVAWVDLTPEERERAAKNGIRREEDWLDAMSEFVPMGSRERAMNMKIGAMDGYSKWHTLRVQRSTAGTNPVFAHLAGTGAVADDWDEDDDEE